MSYRDKFSKEVTTRGITMKMVGGWLDLVAYYSGSDGNCWSYSQLCGCGDGWVNNGPMPTFRTRFSEGHYRGELIG